MRNWFERRTSRIDGSDGPISTLTLRPFRTGIHISKSAKKWHEPNLKRSRLPVWATFDEHIPSFYVWKIALFVDLRPKSLAKKEV